MVKNLMKSHRASYRVRCHQFRTSLYKASQRCGSRACIICSTKSRQRHVKSSPPPRNGRPVPEIANNAPPTHRQRRFFFQPPEALKVAAQMAVFRHIRQPWRFQLFTAVVVTTLQ